MNINLLAPLNSTGYGYASQHLLRELSRSHGVALFPIGMPEVEPWCRDAVDAGLRNARFYDGSAPSVRIFAQERLAEHVGRGPRAGFSFFEIDPLTDAEAHSLNQMDRVLVASKWAADLAARSGVDAAKVRVVPLGVDRDVFHEGVRGDPLYADQTVFFAAGKWEVRKGHDVVLSAFSKAFGPADRVVLRMLCEMPPIGPYVPAVNREWASRALSSPMGRAGRVRVEPRLPRLRDVARFMASCDAGLFPARVEGWNLELLEAMSLGKPLAATNYGAHTEYATADNATLIEPDGLEPADDGLFFRGHGSWARLGPDQEDALVAFMRECHRVKQGGGVLANPAGVETAKRFSWANSASRLVESLAELT